MIKAQVCAFRTLMLANCDPSCQTFRPPGGIQGTGSNPFESTESICKIHTQPDRITIVLLVLPPSTMVASWSNETDAAWTRHLTYIQLPTVHRFIAKCWSYATCHVYLKCIRDNGSWRDLPPKTLQHLKSSRIGSQRISKEKAVYPPSREDATMKPILNTLQKKKQLWKTLKNNRSIQTPIQPRPLFNELAERPRSHQSWGTRSLLAFLQNPPHPLLSWPYIAG